MPGSRMSRSRAMPARSRAATRSAKKALMRSHTSSADSSTRCARPRPCTACMTTSRQLRRGQLRIEATGRESPGCRSGKSTPRAIAKRCTSGAKLSTETGVASAASAAISGSRRRISSAAATGLASTLLAAAPRSMICAPAATSARAWASAAARSRNRPPSENESSVTLTMPRRVGSRWHGSARAQRRTGALEDRADAVGIGERRRAFRPTPAPARPVRSAKQALQIRSAKPSHRSIWPDAAISRIAATIFS